LGELVLVGLGLFDDADMSLRALEVARSADSVFAEFYTSAMPGADLGRLERRLGRPVRVLSREDLEQRADAVLDAAAGGTAVLLVAGDPMAATTHVDLRLRAEGRGIRTRLVHGASIVTAAFTELGLSVYKSGRVTTIKWPRGSYFPTSPYDAVRDNLRAGLHTLCLLDIHADEARCMTADEGCRLLLRYEEERHEGALGPGTLACVVARAGAPDCVRHAGELGDLARADFGAPLHCIVLPGQMHFMEAEALASLAGAPPGLLERHGGRGRASGAGGGG
jgi:diphthine synthase